MSKTIVSTIGGWGTREILATSRRVTQWTFAALRLALLVACLFLVSWVVNYNPVSWDLSESKLFSLTDQTKTVLATLEDPVEMIAFVQGGEGAGVERILRGYADESQLVHFRLVDPEAEPGLAAEHQIRDYNKVIVTSGDRVQRVDEINEPAMTNAILAVARGEAVPLCFLMGHGERNPSNREREGLSAALTALNQTNYELRGINIAGDDGVSEDCRLVVIAGPQTDILPEERELLRGYLQDGGRLLVMLESRTEVPELVGLVAEHGVTVNNDFVIDTRRNGAAFNLSMMVPMVDTYAPHPVTDGFRLMTLYTMPRSLTVADPMPEGFDARVLAESTEGSWSETDLEEGSKLIWDEGIEARGPLPYVVAVSTPVEETAQAYRVRMRAGLPEPVGDPILIAMGDVDFASNAYFAWQGNGDLMLNAVNWLADQQELISITAKTVSNKRVLLSETQKALAFVLLVLLLPVLPAIAGVTMMIKKVK